MAWQSLQLPKPPDAVTQGLEALSGAVDTATGAIEALVNVLDTLAKFVPSGLSTADNLALEALKAVQSSLESFLTAQGIYVLFVPPRPQIPIPGEIAERLSMYQPQQSGSDYLNSLAPTLETQKLLQGSRLATGGTGGFVRSVLESLDDVGDPNRPVLATTDAVAGVYLVMGGSDAAVVGAQALAMSQAFKGETATPQPSMTLIGAPNAQELRAQKTATGVRLTWALPGFSTGGFKDLVTQKQAARVTEVAVIRGTHPKQLTAENVGALFGTTKLSKGTEAPGGTTARPAAKVIAVLKGFMTTYLDEEKLEEETAYFYTIALRCAFGSIAEVSQGKGKDGGYNTLSNTVKQWIPKGASGPARTSGGTPPDWFRTPRAVDIFPAMGKAMDTLMLQVQGMMAPLRGENAAVQSIIDGLRAQLAVYEARGAELQAVSKQLAALSAIPTAGVHMRSFAGTGGTAFLRKDLLQAFSHDSNRPVYAPTDFVAGIILLATTQDAVAILQTFFSNAAGAVSPMAAAIASLDVALAGVEAAMDPKLAPSPDSEPAKAVGEAYCYHPPTL